MKAYSFTAFRTERLAANGTIDAASPEQARDKILERYYDCDGEGLLFTDLVDGECPDHIIITDPDGTTFDFKDEPAPDLSHILKTLIEKADNLIAAIEGITCQFEPEVSALADAASAAESVLEAGAMEGHHFCIRSHLRTTRPKRRA